MINLQSGQFGNPKSPSERIFSPNAFQEGIKRPPGTSSTISGQKVQPTTKAGTTTQGRVPMPRMSEAPMK
jgi:hypothetical protein